MKKQLLEFWKKSKVITDENVLKAFEKIERKNFMLKEHKYHAYDDVAMPILADQTISQPSTVMIMSQALEVKKSHKVLEIGTGSGYQAAILSKLVGAKGKVISTEIIPELFEFSKENLKKEKIKNVKVLLKDGSMGYKKEAPYDRIIVTAAGKEIPKSLIDQLKDNGILIAPVGSISTQQMIKLKKMKNKVKKEKLGYFRFVPLRGKYGRH